MSLTPPHFALLICDDAEMFMVFVMWKCSKLLMSWCGCKFILSYGCGVFMVILYVALWCQSDLWVDVAANHQPCVALWVTSDYEGEWPPMKSKKKHLSHESIKHPKTKCKSRKTIMEFHVKTSPSAKNKPEAAKKNQLKKQHKPFLLENIQICS